MPIRSVSEEHAMRRQADSANSQQRHPRPVTNPLLFAARMRAARAVLGWSQTELGKRAKVTQRAIFRIEKAAVRARHQTEVRINKVFREAGVAFQELPNGGFEMSVPSELVTKSVR